MASLQVDKLAASMVPSWVVEMVVMTVAMLDVTMVLQLAALKAAWTDHLMETPTAD